MGFRSNSSRGVAAAGVALLCGAATLLGPEGNARAENVSPTGKGIVGGGLLGAEVVTMVEGIADVSSGWAYLIGAVVGAGGGAVGGYFVEQNTSDGKVAGYMLAGGLALVIPAVVLTLNGTRYRPQEGATEDHTPSGPPADPGAPGKGIVAPQPTSRSDVEPAHARAREARPAAAPPALSLLDVRGGDVRLGVPVVDLRPVYSLADQRQYGLKAETEVRMPMLHVAF